MKAIATSDYDMELVCRHGTDIIAGLGSESERTR